MTKIVDKQKETKVIPVIALEDMGLTTRTLFSADVPGGDAILSSTYSNIQFMSAGGTNASNANSYFSIPRVTAYGGIWIVDKKLTQISDWS